MGARALRGNLAGLGWLEGARLPCRLTSSNQCSHSKSHAPLHLLHHSNAVTEEMVPSIHSYATLCSWRCTYHLSLLFTLLIKPEPYCVEGNLCSWRCSFHPHLSVDIPSHQEGLLKLLFPDIIIYQNGLLGGCLPPVHSISGVSMCTLLCFGSVNCL